MADPLLWRGDTVQFSPVTCLALLPQPPEPHVLPTSMLPPANND